MRLTKLDFLKALLFGDKVVCIASTGHAVIYQYKNISIRIFKESE